MMESELTRHDSDSTLNRNERTSWIERTFQKRECCKFVASSHDNNKCGCGRVKGKHYIPVPPTSSFISTSNSLNETTVVTEKWSPQPHTEASSTDAYGTVEFQGGPHPTKAQFVRLSYDTSPELILQLLQNQWKLELPKLLISVHGGIANFDLQPKLEGVFKKGLLKAAKTTGAWIVSAGINTGVVRHVGNSLGDTLLQARNNIVTLGCAPWGVVHNRQDLVGKDCVTPYHAIGAPKMNSVVLNSNHSYFLLVDNGTVGKYGCEILLRKKLEKYIQQQKIHTRSGSKTYSTPVLCLVLEGGTNTIRTVLECITDTPPVPVVVCDGSGRAADLLAFTHKYAQEDGTMPETLRDQLILTIEKTFRYSREQAEKLFIELMLCVKKKELITVFRMGEESHDIDLAILTALLKAQNASCTDQLSLALAWNRVDLARSHIFLYGQEWPEGTLDQAMLDALMNDRVDFVKLLIENGVSMQKWLTISRLEELYNIKQDPSSTLRYLVRDNKKNIPPNYRYTLYDIGQVIEQLMGGAYRASFCRKKFKAIYNTLMKKSNEYESDSSNLPRKGTVPKGLGHHISSIITEMPLPVNVDRIESLHVFKYPFHELMVWAVLMKRQRMAKFMWQHGEEALAKALVACRLYKSMAHEAAMDDLEEEISTELKNYARDFSQLALELLEQCYLNDDDTTQQLLTYELSEWSDQTCLGLAVAAKHRDLIAHTCCQILLSEMWMGALRMRKYISFKVALGILFFPSIVFLEFKSKEEMLLMPQTVEEHIMDMEDSDSDSDTASSVSSNSRSTRLRVNQNESIDLTKPTSNGILPFNDNHYFSLHAHRKSPLRLGKKIYEFYTAPVTKFWFHSFGYAIFLLMMTYTVLVRMHRLPHWLEWYTIAYVFTLFIEKWREVIVSEPKKVSQKLYVYYTEVWNICDSIAIILTTAGCILRFFVNSFPYGKVLYCSAIVFWYIRLLDIFSVSKYLGPYVTMIGKMMKDLLNFIVILLIVLLSFGIVRQAITFPEERPNWSLIKHVFLKPYFMIYGEVYAAEIDPADCSDEPGSMFICSPGRWLVPAVMSIYLIVANILLINLLIAVFNNTFNQVNAISNQIWKFQRYSLVIEYESRPILPPPFILVCHLYLLIRFFIRLCRGKKHHFDNGLKLFLEPDEVEKVHDFEEEAMADLFRKKDETVKCSSEERIRLTNERVENMSLRLDDINQKENTVRLSMQTVDYRLAKLENMLVQSLQGMEKLQDVVKGLKCGVREPTDVVACQSSVYTTVPRTKHNGNGQKIRVPQVKHVASKISRFDYTQVTVPQRKKSRNEDRLRPFTDYSTKPYNRRPPLHRSYTVGAPVSLSKELEDIYTSYASEQVLPEQASEEAKASVNLATSRLWERRNRKKRAPLMGALNRKAVNAKAFKSGSHKDYSPVDERHEFGAIDGASSAPVSFKQSTTVSRPTGTRVTFSEQYQEPVSSDKVQGHNSPRKGSLPVSIPKNSDAGDSGPRQRGKLTHCLSEGSGLYLELNHSLKLREETEISQPESCNVCPDGFTSGPKFATAMPNRRTSLDHKFALPAVAPIITPTRVEYTTITDDIDTSFLNNFSPRGSPTTPKPGAFEAGVDLYTQKEPRNVSSARRQPLRTRYDAVLEEQSGEHQLKCAEEAEHEQMEIVLRKRMRQISLTERDSLGDIAALFINEIEPSLNEQGIDDEPLYFSDEDIRSGRLDLARMESTRMRHVSSEPSLKISRSPSLCEQSLDELKTKSQSPLVQSPNSQVPTVAVEATQIQFVFPKIEDIVTGDDATC